MTAAQAAAAETRLHVERRGAVEILTISNPAQRNALGPAVYRGLGEAVDRAAADPTLRAFVITGDGGIFCGGGNLNRLRDNQSKPREHQAASIDILHGAVRRMRACPLPFIAAVEGAAAGAGFSIALQCDLIVAAEDARFIMAYVKIGLTPDGGGSAMLGQLLPRQLAYELMALGEPIDAPRLAAAGVVSRCVRSGTALDEALRLAERLTRGPGEALGRIKRLSNAAVAAQDAQLDLERDFMVESVHGSEGREGIAAFLEKRAPDFGCERKSK
ncbi:MAG: enoyl-CoA hydratase/isomerase family protein [Burkholderiales bacterium]|nr:enoyl-CoA hydratase/isomerase family protein [Burkholderiales bacterium]